MLAGSSCKHPVEHVEDCESRPGMASIQCRGLLVNSEIFEKQLVTTAGESKDSIRQETKRAYHVRVLSRFAWEPQCRILLKSGADRNMAIDSQKEGCWHLDSYECGVLFRQSSAV